MRMKRILIERMRLLALVAVVFALTFANAQEVTFAGTVLTLDEYKNYQGTTNIDISISPYGKLSATYNLQGRRVTSQPWPSMYIREGKVVVVKNRPQ